MRETERKCFYCERSQPREHIHQVDIAALMKGGEKQQIHGLMCTNCRDFFEFMKIPKSVILRAEEENRSLNFCAINLPASFFEKIRKEQLCKRDKCDDCGMSIESSELETKAAHIQIESECTYLSAIVLCRDCSKKDSWWTSELHPTQLFFTLQDISKCNTSIYEYIQKVRKYCMYIRDECICDFCHKKNVSPVKAVVLMVLLRDGMKYFEAHLCDICAHFSCPSRIRYPILSETLEYRLGMWDIFPSFFDMVRMYGTNISNE